MQEGSAARLGAVVEYVSSNRTAGKKRGDTHGKKAVSVCNVSFEDVSYNFLQ